MGNPYHWPPPVAEQTQDGLWNYPWTPWPILDIGTRRSAPAELPYKEYDPILGGWWQGDKRLKNFKPKLYFTRPCDGKRTGTMGRLKDAVTGKGPDVFVTLSGDKRTLMKDRPQRWQWTNWGDLVDENYWERRMDKDWRPQDEMPIYDAGWTEGSRTGQGYNFRKREFQSPKPWWYTKPYSDKLWVNAQWPEGAKSGSRNPLSKQFFGGEWVHRVPWDSGWDVPWHLRRHGGGRPRAHW